MTAAWGKEHGAWGRKSDLQYRVSRIQHQITERTGLIAGETWGIINLLMQGDSYG